MAVTQLDYKDELNKLYVARCQFKVANITYDTRTPGEDHNKGFSLLVALFSKNKKIQYNEIKITEMKK